ncbi:hypothetical protein OH76DRAFT_872238 [Lentinus brumalis]|uniref:Uncharacterized protein n=1 Tax=Lentinus brumalis TaxID=2498619 RepID=A0A371DRL9_9APHY|nr:hypothetical protein OH76DRAFT_872238 [Polyporus brumalis]
MFVFLLSPVCERTSCPGRFQLRRASCMMWTTSLHRRRHSLCTFASVHRSHNDGHTGHILRAPFTVSGVGACSWLPMYARVSHSTSIHDVVSRSYRPQVGTRAERCRSLPWKRKRRRGLGDGGQSTRWTTWRPQAAICIYACLLAGVLR